MFLTYPGSQELNAKLDNMRADELHYAMCVEEQQKQLEEKLKLRSDTMQQHADLLRRKDREISLLEETLCLLQAEVDMLRASVSKQCNEIAKVTRQESLIELQVKQNEQLYLELVEELGSRLTVLDAKVSIVEKRLSQQQEVIRNMDRHPSVGSYMDITDCALSSSLPIEAAFGRTRSSMADSADAFELCSFAAFKTSRETSETDKSVAPGEVFTTAKELESSSKHHHSLILSLKESLQDCDGAMIEDTLVDTVDNTPFRSDPGSIHRNAVKTTNLPCPIRSSDMLKATEFSEFLGTEDREQLETECRRRFTRDECSLPLITTADQRIPRIDESSEKTMYYCWQIDAAKQSHPDLLIDQQGKTISTNVESATHLIWYEPVVAMGQGNFAKTCSRSISQSFARSRDSLVMRRSAESSMRGAVNECASIDYPRSQPSFEYDDRSGTTDSKVNLFIVPTRSLSNSGSLDVASPSSSNLSYDISIVTSDLSRIDKRHSSHGRSRLSATLIDSINARTALCVLGTEMHKHKRHCRRSLFSRRQHLGVNDLHRHHKRFVTLSPNDGTINWYSSRPASTVFAPKSHYIDAIFEIMQDSSSFRDHTLHDRSLLILSDGRKLIFTAYDEATHILWYQVIQHLLNERTVYRRSASTESCRIVSMPGVFARDSSASETQNTAVTRSATRKVPTTHDEATQNRKTSLQACSVNCDNSLRHRRSQQKRPVYCVPPPQSSRHRRSK